MDYILYSFLAGMFTWILTIIGSLAVFGLTKKNNRIISLLLGLGGGIMIAASFFSLIIPAIDVINDLGKNTWLICAIGFCLGCVLIIIFDYFLTEKSNIKEEKRSGLLLVLSIILHNIPEGLAIGVAFGSVSRGLDSASLSSAALLSIGIGLQNLPEGAAISIPLAATGMPKKKAFFIGAISAIVEPISAVIGTVLVLLIRNILPYMLLIAAAIMIYVVIDEIIPTSRKYHHKFTTIGFIVGFIIMMILDLSFS